MGEADLKPTPEDMARAYILCYAASQFEQYQIAKHHQVIAAHLEALERREIKRLLITMPPRHGKTMDPLALLTKSDLSKVFAKDILPGDELMGYLDGKIVSNTVVATEPAFKPTITIKTRTGRTIKVSHDHPMLTRDKYGLEGYTPAEDMAKSDSLVRLIEEDETFAPDQIISFTFGPAEELIHIETTGTHNYIANDFVSHNTMLASEFFSAWYMGRHPDHEIMFSTYSKERAMDIGLKVKHQLESDAYHNVFSTELSSNSKSKAHLATTEGGAFYATGVGGAITGRGANLFLMDDLVKSREDAESEVSRKRLLDWYRGTAYTRLMAGGVICLITTRWHNFDIAGTLLEEFKKDWVHLDLPAICEKNRDSIGRKKGEPLWPEMFPIKTLKEIKKVIGTREFNAQYQQRPIGAEGSIIKLDWFNHYARRPSEFRRVIQSWDTAYDGKSIHDPSVCTVWGEFVDGTSTTYFLLDVWRQRVDYPIVKKAIFSMYQRWPETSKILIENRTSGKSIVKDLQQTNLPILPIIGQGSKEIRAMSISGIIEAGKVCIHENAKWLYTLKMKLLNSH